MTQQHKTVSDIGHSKVSYEEIEAGCTIRPLRDFVVIKKTEKKQEGLIFVVKLDERVLTGRIVAKGCGVLTQNGEQHDIEVKIGDEVVFDKMSAVPVSHRGEDYWVTNELSLRAVLLPETK